MDEEIIKALGQEWRERSLGDSDIWKERRKGFVTETEKGKTRAVEIHRGAKCQRRAARDEKILKRSEDVNVKGSNNVESRDKGGEARAWKKTDGRRVDISSFVC